MLIKVLHIPQSKISPGTVNCSNLYYPFNLGQFILFYHRRLLFSMSIFRGVVHTLSGGYSLQKDLAEIIRKVNFYILFASGFPIMVYPKSTDL